MSLGGHTLRTAHPDASVDPATARRMTGRRAGRLARRARGSAQVLNLARKTPGPRAGPSA